MAAENRVAERARGGAGRAGRMYTATMMPRIVAMITVRTIQRNSTSTIDEEQRRDEHAPELGQRQVRQIALIRPALDATPVASAGSCCPVRHQLSACSRSAIRSSASLDADARAKEAVGIPISARSVARHVGVRREARLARRANPRRRGSGRGETASAVAGIAPSPCPRRLARCPSSPPNPSRVRLATA